MSRARRVIEAGAVLGMVLAVAACDPGSDVAPDGYQASTFRTGDGIWIGNGLLEPDVSDVDPAQGLDTGLGSEGELSSDPAGVMVATYLVECALPEGESVTAIVDGEPLVLEGALGLAPEWQDGPCDEECQAWVSACLLARTNASGQTVRLWLAAEHPAIGLGRAPGQPLYEATFYGNLFADPDARHLCRGPQADGGPLGEYLRSRTCGGQPVEACGFTDWGRCNDADRCVSANGFATECAVGEPASAVRLPAISTFVSLDGWRVDGGGP
jgi:hypothetical protein